MQAPIYDVPTAAEVLDTGSYPLLPATISELRPPPPPKPSERAAALRLMDQHIRTQLLQVRCCTGVRCIVSHQSAGRAAGHLLCVQPTHASSPVFPRSEIVLCSVVQL